MLLPKSDVASANPVPRSAWLPAAVTSAPSPADTFRMPRVSEKMAAWVTGAGGCVVNRRTGRVAAAPRRTHFQSSVIRLPLSTSGYDTWIVLNRLFRLTFSRLRNPGFTRMSRLSAGTNDASDTRIEYTSGRRFGKRNSPRSSVRTFWNRRSWRVNRSTVAPNCGMPAESETIPPIAPENLIGVTAGAAAGNARYEIPNRRVATVLCVVLDINQPRLFPQSAWTSRKACPIEDARATS